MNGATVFDPATVDGEAIARLTTVDTQASVGAVAAQRKKETAESAATGPQPEITINPVTGTVTAKNVPLKSFQQQVQDAESKPWVDYVRGLQSTISQAKRVRDLLPDPEGPDIDERLRTQEGRDDIAAEMGLVDPQKSDFFADNTFYRRLTSERNAAQLKAALAEHRWKRRQEVEKDSSGAFRELATAENMRRQDERADAAQQKYVDGLLTSDKFHVNRLAKTPDEAVDYMKKLAEAHGEEWNDDLYAPLVRMKYADGLAADAKVEHEEKVKAAKEDATIAHLTASTRAIAKTMSDKGKSNDPASSIADAIIAGEQPPVLTGLYRMAGPVRAALAAKHYDLTHATEDWTATQKYLSSLNGSQQLRLRQAVDFTHDSLDVVEELANEWKAGGFPLLNRAKLTAARNGALGAKAQSIATRLESQISDLVSELGTVYKGGNSSTDESLKLAAQNLRSEWSLPTLLDNVNQVRRNLEIRRNSLRASGPIAGSGNPYAPQVQTPAPSGVTPEGQSILDELRRRYPKGGKKP